MPLPEFLTKHYGPLPGWGWLLGAGAGGLAYWYFHRGSGQPQGSTLYQTPPTQDGFGGGGGGFDTGTGTGGTGTGSTGTGTAPVGGTPTTGTPMHANPGPPAINIGDMAPWPVQMVNPPDQVQLPFGQQPYIPGTPPGPSPNWIQVPAGATPNPRDVMTTPDGVRWMLKAASVQNVLNGSGGYGPVNVPANDQAFVNSMRLAGHDDIVSMGYLDPSSVHGAGGDAVLTVPGSPGWEYEQNIAHQFEQAMQGQGLSPRAANVAAGLADNPALSNVPTWSLANPNPAWAAAPAAPAPNVAAPAPVIGPLYGSQPFSDANPNMAQPPGPPPAPPPIPVQQAQPQYGDFASNIGSGGLSYNGVPGGLPEGPIGLTFG